MDYATIYEHLKELLGEKRFIHTLGVEEMAIKLAKHYGASVEKARLAALLHDCAKDQPRFHLLQRLESSDIVVDDMEREIEVLLHGPAGAVLAKEEFGITDPEILRAIRYHTTGSPEMTLLDKIIFLADYIEPNRDCQGIEELRKLSFEDLDHAVAEAAGRTIIYEINRKNPIHIRILETRNALLRKGEQ